jgi:DNA-binding Lrp family transcriptional regulator
MSVAIATKVFGSEVLVALIRHYRLHAGSQAEAAKALNLPTQVVSDRTRTLESAGVVVANPKRSGGRPGRYIVDEQRVRELLAALSEFVQPPLDDTH